ncbi:EH domain-binding protein 1 isoform X2 [Drosophila willistoni]|uniref:EH domain-binding protein 1 isoform X2 n=1 Tax=Drosophila willistoni TaxID=7260 RepID=UPI000C26C78A|nr:EH domain-binding protein 1 isoform X2 [Drosophila willistoni]
MGSVWKRLQRVNKRAAKFQFTASYHDLRLETTAKWRPSNLAVVWMRRSRRVASAPLPWEPDMMNPLIGNISWPVPDNHAISVTLFKDPRTHELEDKDWTFVIEDITPLGKKRVLANASINMRKYASIESTQQSFTLNLKPVSRKITSANLELTISCVFLREGKATDEDMQSVISMMSVNNNCDVAPLDDLEDIPDLENSGDISDHLYDFTQQLEQLTTSLNGCIDAASTPLSEADSADRAKADQTVNEKSGGLTVDSEESLKTPNGAQIQPLAVSTTPTNDAPPSAVAAPDRSLGFSKMLTSTPIDRPAAKTETVKSARDGAKAKALSFDKDDKSKPSKAVASVECRIEVESSSNVKTETTTRPVETQDKKPNLETSAPAVTNTKRADLQPLNLKKSYEVDPANTTQSQTVKIDESKPKSTLKPVEKIILKENTPGQDLLEWCKDITKDYPNVKVTNLTTSWRNGMAFCAIIHHFVPHLIDMSKLSAHDVVGNCRTAFDAAESLGIPRVIEPRDMNLLTVPDKLAVMTYLHQLRAHFTGKQLEIQQIGTTADESSYVIGNYKSDNLSQNLLNFSHLKTQLLHQNSFEDETGGGVDKMQSQLSPSNKKDVKNIILYSSKSILGKVLSPAKDKNSINALQHGNQTSLTPLDGNGDLNTNATEDNTLSLTPSVLDANATNRILTRHKEMSEKAKLMMEKLKISNGSERCDANDEERQQRLREQARRLILETRSKTGVSGSLSVDSPSPTSPTKPKRFNFTQERTISPIHNGGDDYHHNENSKLKHGSGNKIISSSHRLSDHNPGSGSPLQSFNSVVDRISPKHEKKSDKLSYIESELEALEREQEAIDQKASNLEAKLRAVMGGNPSNNSRTNRNPFLRLIRNSIGGGDVIRIKLLDSDDESLFGSGVDHDPVVSSDTDPAYSSGDDAHLQVHPRPRSHSCFVNVNPNTNLAHPHSPTNHTNQRHFNNHDHHYPRSRSRPRQHHVHDVPYSHLLSSPASAASSKQSSCDNLQDYSDGDDDDDVASAAIRRRQERHKRRHQRRRLRSHSHCETEETEEQLLSQWFTLVNKKNALLRRQMQLNILEQEKDLERKFTMLNQELRAAQSVEDWRKTEVQREKERLLLEELLTIVDKRDQLVQHLHNQEIAIEDDHEIARELEQVDISGGKDKCVVQ